MLNANKRIMLRALISEESNPVVINHLKQAVFELERRDLDNTPPLSDKVKAHLIFIDGGVVAGHAQAIRLYREETDLPLYTAKLKIEDYVRQLKEEWRHKHGQV